MVDLPPGGVKRLKNSRKMQMVFFIHYGRVMVKVGNTNFSIGKGGMWQVPRGESISCFLVDFLVGACTCIFLYLDQSRQQLGCRTGVPQEINKC